MVAFMAMIMLMEQVDASTEMASYDFEGDFADRMLKTTKKKVKKAVKKAKAKKKAKSTSKKMKKELKKLEKKMKKLAKKNKKKHHDSNVVILRSGAIALAGAVITGITAATLF